MKIVAIIQARMGSTRLPGKIVRKVMDKTILEYQLERVQQSKLIDEVIVATTQKESDNVIVALCQHLGIHVYRGSENDVLARYYEAAVECKAGIIVRLTSDCPLIDAEVIDQVIQLYLDRQGEIDYASNIMERTFPRGLDTEVFSFRALQKAYESASLERDREHVTAYLYTNPGEFQLGNITSSQNLGSHRWTVDTEEDFELIRRIIESLYPQKAIFTVQDIIELLDENPAWVEINAHIEQKKL
ncbi:cytidylyltransferase domain-containing protein [Sporosarcina limicola]|uniref:Spore coat polysaccharide biosynthesis protein SpsF n=1 Tax=Sporosarcina limicola TaxID=34101 RepID=A0A927MHY0_9BACL|nr:glycosyltransferase family protein [Sporosarcina limicola]MBE1555019.1 spore coat polysaccharide biosynthesis protein SpsF [Sporosarcina limicola]